MQDFEKLGAFYLGREYDASSRTVSGRLLLYDSSDLVTHALIVGMTGSGKTGLGITLIEEAAIDGVPVIVIDPKGDLTNLLLTFPALRPEDFAPWVDDGDARRAGQSRDAFAADQAARWRTGLVDSGQDGSRIQKLREAADFALYTPGSTAATPVSVLGTFARPAATDADLFRERVQTTVSSLLALAGIESEPMKGREHILLATVLGALWQAGESPDLAALVHAVQQPPMARIGVIDVDSFFPPKDRFEFAMSINALLASPGFEVWTEGAPLDVSAFLRTPEGKPRVSIFSIAHLDDGQRMFFVALLLNAVTGWMRAQGGTTSLRAVVYMDEIFGFFPPVANPPSKLPLLTLLKQGRAAGLGLVLATQNPVDLDYKGLSNIGTWFLGRLQTDRDKARVLDGLEAADGAGLDRAAVDRLLSALTMRMFLMRNVHEDGLTVFQSRWALSYLRGPLGREEMKRLPVASAPLPLPDVGAARTAQARRPVIAADTAAAPAGERPVLPPDVPQFFAPVASSSITLAPELYGAVEVRFVDTKLKVNECRLVTLVTQITEGAVPVDWQDAQRIDLEPDALEREPPAGGRFAPVPPAATRPRNYAAWGKQLAAWMADNESVELLRSPSSGAVSRIGESESDFRGRLQQASREHRDRSIEALRRKYAPKQASLDEKLRRAKQALEREEEQASGQKTQTAISLGATLMGALLGRKTISGTLGRATTAARSASRTSKEKQDVERARETIATIEEQRRQLEDNLHGDIAALEAATSAATEPLDRIVVRPKRTHVTVKLVALVWRTQIAGAVPERSVRLTPRP